MIAPTLEPAQLSAPTVEHVRRLLHESQYADARAWRRICVVVGNEGRVELLTRAFVCDVLRPHRVELAYAVLTSSVPDGHVIVLDTDDHGDPRVAVLNMSRRRAPKRPRKG